MEFKSIKELSDKYEYELSDYLIVDDTKVNADSQLDDLCELFENSNLSLIGSRAGMGKTSLMLQVLIGIAKTKQRPVYIILLENEVKQNIKTILKMTNDNLNDLPIYICEKSNLSINELTDLCLQDMKNAVLFIDYFGLIKSPSTKRTVSKLKIFSAEKQILIILCTNIKRPPVARKEQYPIISDINCPKYFDNIIFVQREPYYKTDYEINPNKIQGDGSILN